MKKRRSLFTTEFWVTLLAGIGATILNMPIVLTIIIGSYVLSRGFSKTSRGIYVEIRGILTSELWMTLAGLGLLIFDCYRQTLSINETAIWGGIMIAVYNLSRGITKWFTPSAKLNQRPPF